MRASWATHPIIDDVKKQAQWEIDLENFEKAVEQEKDRLRNPKRHWFPWRITITNLNRRKKQ